MNSPILKICIDEIYDARQFQKFLFHGFLPELRARILERFPWVFDSIFSSDEWLLREAISRLYREKTHELEMARGEYERAAKDIFPRAIWALMEAMDVDLDETQYRGILTLLPFCPFDDDRRTFSLRLGDSGIHAMHATIHEISHFYYEKWLDKEKIHENLEYTDWIHYVVKESITPVILRSGKLGEFFSDSRGNQNVEMLKMAFGCNFVEYVEQIYHSNHGRFEPFVREVIEMAIYLREQLEDKKLLWDAAHVSGISLFEKEKLFVQYSRSIML